MGSGPVIDTDPHGDGLPPGQAASRTPIAPAAVPSGVPSWKMTSFDDAKAELIAAANKWPICDPHTHLDPGAIARNDKFETITEVLLRQGRGKDSLGDHYTWNLLRRFGITDRQIFDTMDDRELFKTFANFLPRAMGNPVQQWTNGALRSIFGVNTPLRGDSADEIFDRCNILLKQDDFSVQGLLKKQRIEIVCTTDSPTDSLEWHIRHDELATGITMLPTWRPDAIFYIEQKENFNGFRKALEKQTGITIASYGNLLDALRQRQQFFHHAGCRMADHGPDNVYFPDDLKAMIRPGTDKDRGLAYGGLDRSAVVLRMTQILDKRLATVNDLPIADVHFFKAVMQLDLCRMNAEAGWSQQLHIGPYRKVNSTGTSLYGADRGYDAMGPLVNREALVTLLDTLDKEGALARTVVYPLNPGSYVEVAVNIQRFSKENQIGWCTLGIPWWFNDQGYTLRSYFETMQNYDALGLGHMVSDSRSCVSGVRFGWMRGRFAGYLAEKWSDGEFGDINLEDVISNAIDPVCFRNATRLLEGTSKAATIERFAERYSRPVTA